MALPEDLLPWHVDPWARLLASRRADRLPHALLLKGPAGVGKQVFADRLAAALVCEAPALEAQPCGQCQACRLAAGGSHPDLHRVAPAEEGKPIRIDAIRELIGQSGLTTTGQGMQVFVISPADAMNRAAANALLKTLEEPSGASCLILVSSAPHRLPATIRSRCQVVAFRPVPREQARQWLAARVQAGDIEAALDAAGGAPLLAQALLETEGLERLHRLADELIGLGQRRTGPLEVAQAWAERPITQQLADLRRVVFDLARLCVTDADSHVELYLGGKRMDLQKLAKDINLQKIFHFKDEIDRLERLASHNLNSQMMMERLVNDWLSLTRPEKH